MAKREEVDTIKADSCFTSNTDMWETPQVLFDDLDREFHFDLDAAALPENAKCENYYTPEVNGLLQNWGRRTIWCNPPYGEGVGKWVRKASEACGQGSTVVMLIPSRTDTLWFHDCIYNKPNVEVRFIKGRIRFNGSSIGAPFPSMIVIFRPEEESDAAELDKPGQ